MNGSWQKLLYQAFQNTKVPTNANNSSGFWNIRSYVYTVLQNAGIENRSPFTLPQLISIRYLSKGNPDQVRHLCLQTLQNMERPSASFDRSNSLPLLLALSLIAAFIITPKKATTFLTPTHKTSILIDQRSFVGDIDETEIVLPSTTDYLSIASLPMQAAAEPRHQSGLNGSTWIKNQNNSSYTLQLVSASNINSLVRFCQKHQICDQSSYYQTEINGKPLYRLLYGVYNNHKKAKIALSNLPENLKNHTPWARQFKQIKHDL